MQDIVKRLDDLSKEIKAAEKQQAELMGQIKEMERRLQEEFDCKSVEEAEQKMQTLAEQRAGLQKEVQERFAELEAMYEW